MSGLDIHLGSIAYDEVDAVRTGSGRWPLRHDDDMAHKCWQHIIHGILAAGHCYHSDQALRPGQLENVYSGVTHDPVGLICDLIHHGDWWHMESLRCEQLDAQGLAVVAREIRWSYAVILVWRGHLQGH